MRCIGKRLCRECQTRQGERTIFEPPRLRLTVPPIPEADGISLFLDLDGTLLDLVDRPDDVVADEALRTLLLRLADRLEGRLALVSGRSIAQMDAILGPVADRLALSGSHGSEHRWRGVTAHPIRPHALDEARERLRAFAEGRDGVLVEDKSFGVALHYRMAPDVEKEAQALTDILANTLDLVVQPGKMMTELRLPGGDKGKALLMLMDRAPMQGTLPWFLGDDATDEPGFAAARSLGGTGVLVGQREPTAAIHALPDPDAVRGWLERLAQ
ncbi:HAD-superfamily hydrolase subfamily IIB (Family) [Sphingobium sp. SYK-6]|uniref:trehalose-phosphatase n=1 Tax=Sphingobium sp. (strain NBRC 103272 / SYK-6) TaxID=627192 RepID=UPI00022766BF|nr:trehalose-phosphatase [Sphingobium sp. SYK-6]BAK65126.1 HAD-superfamily hydrolase subfamily IIB (Family) [Sphingobium sp. SYK-6]